MKRSILCDIHYSTFSFFWLEIFYQCLSILFSGFIDKRRYLYSNKVAPLVHQHLSKALFIVMLRDPVERLFSHFHILENLEKCSFPPFPFLPPFFPLLPFSFPSL